MGRGRIAKRYLFLPFEGRLFHRNQETPSAKVTGGGTRWYFRRAAQVEGRHRRAMMVHQVRVRNEGSKLLKDEKNFYFFPVFLNIIPECYLPSDDQPGKRKGIHA
jgi:hypothetical protein